MFDALMTPWILLFTNEIKFKSTATFIVDYMLAFNFWWVSRVSEIDICYTCGRLSCSKWETWVWAMGKCKDWLAECTPLVPEPSLRSAAGSILLGSGLSGARWKWYVDIVFYYPLIIFSIITMSGRYGGETLVVATTTNVEITTNTTYHQTSLANT